MCGNLLSQIVCSRHKANIGAGEEQNQTDVGIGKTHQHSAQTAHGQPQGNGLENTEKQHDGCQRHGNFFNICGETHPEQLPQFGGVGNFGHNGRNIGAAVRLIKHAQNKYRQNGTHGAQGYQTERVIGSMAVVSDGRNTDTQRHDKGYRHGAGGNAARIKGYRPETVGHKNSETENHDIAAHQQIVQRNTKQHTQQGYNQENAHAGCHRKHDDRVGNGRHLLCQNLQIGLGNGDDETQNKAHRYDDPQVFCTGHSRTNLFTHGCHAGLGAQCEEHQAENDHDGAHQVAQQNAGRDRCHREAEDHHDADDWQDCL